MPFVFGLESIDFSMTAFPCAPRFGGRADFHPVDRFGQLEPVNDIPVGLRHEYGDRNRYPCHAAVEMRWMDRRSVFQ